MEPGRKAGLLLFEAESGACSSPRRGSAVGEVGRGQRRCLGQVLRLDQGDAMAKVVSVASKLRRDRARRLRRDQTDAEARLWEALRAGRLGGWKWRRQAPVGPFIVDFLCLEAALAVELDGAIHLDQAEHDARREAYLRVRGLQVLRFWNAEVSDDLERVCQTILSACCESDPRRCGKRIDRRA